MQFNKRQIIILSGLLPLTFVVATLLFLLLFGYIYPYDSTAFGNWAMWVGAIATIFAAIGTVGSLIMLKNQHKENLEINHFAMRVELLKAHREEFHSKLKLMSKDSTDVMLSFPNSLGVYEQLFPNNGLESVSLKGDFSNSFYYGQDLLRNQKSLKEHILKINRHKMVSSTKACTDLINTIDKVFKCLQIEITLNDSWSLYKKNGTHIIDIIEPQRVINIIEQVTHTYLHFAKVKDINVLRKLPEISDIGKLALLNNGINYSSRDNTRGIGLSVQASYRKRVQTLYSLYSLVLKEKFDDYSDFLVLREEFSFMFNTKGGFSMYINDNERFLNNIMSYIEILDEYLDKNKDGDVITLKENLMNSIKKI